jgi:hypothetical protein
MRLSPRRRGYSLVIVMMTLGLMMVAMLSLWAHMHGSGKATGETIKKRAVFYTCDGMSRVAGQLVAAYVKQATGPLDRLDAQNYVDSASPHRLRNMLPSGYTLLAFEIWTVKNNGDLAVPNGPFAGVVGQETELRFRLKLRETASDFACEIEKTLALSQLGLFQFGMFIDLDRTQFAHRSKPGGGSATTTWGVTGHVHVNGDVCTGDKTNAGDETWIERMTASGNFYKTHTQCNQVSEAPTHALRVGNDPFSTADPSVTKDSTDPAWVAYATTTMSGDLRDKSHGVGALKVPASTNKQPSMQADGTSGTQRGSLRFMVDPPLASESEAEKSSKLAYAADLRIIDGVWYKRDASNPASWPGIAIWSDHPGDTREYVNASFTERRGTLPAGRAVGQGQLATDGALAWAGRVPRRYSYYGWDVAAGKYYWATTGDLPSAADAPVISYGGLTDDPRVGSLRRIPAVLSRSTAAVLTAATSEYCTACVGACSDDVAMAVVNTHDAFCVARNRAGNLAAAAASGFSDTHLAATRQRVLTTNFDVEAFQRALEDTTAGELGAHFATTPFNGIVWISSLWPGAWDGFTSGAPSTSDAPPQATINGVPFPLCSESLAGTALDTGVPAMRVPSCTTQMGLTGPVRPWANAVRIINAHSVNSGALLGGATGNLPDGLTIASNLPVYVHGDVNTTSDPARTSADAAVAATWVPVLIAGDTITLLSNSFEDSAVARPAGDPASTYWKTATATEINAAFLTSIPYVANNATRGADLKAAFRLLEQWQTAGDLNINGAVAVGYNPVYAGHWDGGDSSSNGLTRTEEMMPDNFRIFFDYRMQKMSGQPPGSISFNIQSTRRWERY